MGTPSGITRHLVKNQFSSLRSRVLWTALVIVLIFVATTALVLQKAFEHGLIARLQSQLEVQTWALLGRADEIEPGKLFLPQTLQDERLNQISSGRYARVIDDEGREIWRSPSANGLIWPQSSALLSGDVVFFETRIDNKKAYERDFGVTWESSDKDHTEYHYTFQVAESKKSIKGALKNFKYQLYGWLGFLGLALLLVQFVFLKFGLGPLKRISKELKAIETGKKTHLSENYPDELKGLAARINQLLNFEQNQRIRYRDSLADLAHSLKTPLSVLRTGLDKISRFSNTEKNDQRQILDVQLTRINKTLSYYLNRAMVIGSGSSIAPVDITAIIDELQKALDKVYFDKAICSEVITKGKPLFYGNEGDFMELAGNLMDNAYKYGAHSIRVKLEQNIQGMKLTVENDGRRIAEDEREQVLKRGARMDQKGQVSGYGIGLSVVVDIVRAYEGTLQIEHSDLGGTTFLVQFFNPLL